MCIVHQKYAFTQVVIGNSEHELHNICTLVFVCVLYICGNGDKTRTIENTPICIFGDILLCVLEEPTVLTNF